MSSSSELSLYAKSEALSEKKVIDFFINFGEGQVLLIS